MTLKDALSSLRACAELLESGDRRAAYEALRGGWRAWRDDQLGELVERAARVLGDATPIAGKTLKAWQLAWVDRARRADPLDALALLDSLAPRATDPAKASLVTVCLKELAPHVDDPQLTKPLCALLKLPGGSSSWSKVQTALFKLVEGAGDPRAIGLLDELVTHARENPTERPPSIQTSVLERAPKVAARLRARVVKEPLAESEELGQVMEGVRARLGRDLPPMRAATTAKPTSAQALLQAIHDAPWDDTPRHVYADYLQERGDPRGEFIALQMRAGDAEAQRRASALLEKHERAWLGPLAKAVATSTVVFERGFLAACTTDVTRKAEANIVFDRDEWATVTRLTFGSHGELTGKMRALVEVRGLSESALAALATHRFEQLEVLGFAIGSGLRMGKPCSAGLKALASTTGLPRLRELDIRVPQEWVRPGFRTRGSADFAWLLQAPLGAQIEALALRMTVYGSGDPVGAGWADLLRATPRLQRVVLRGLILGTRVTDGTLTIGKHGTTVTAVVSGLSTEQDWRTAGWSEEQARAHVERDLGLLRGALGDVPLTVAPR